MQYTPFLYLLPGSMLTYNYYLPGTISTILSFATGLESTSIVFTLGTNAVHCTTMLPSQGYDIMPIDFNRPFLVAILGALAAVVMVLRNMHRKKTIDAAWA